MNRDDLKNILIACAYVMIPIGIILFFDEIGFWLTGVPVGLILGDWSALHIDPFHHWMWGVLCFFGGLGILIADFITSTRVEE